MQEVYNKDSIKSISAREFTKKRPSTYLGDNTYTNGLITEVFSNSLDEHTAGRGNKIKIDINNGIYKISDEGQGFPINEFREDGESVLQAAFDVINTSGKYDEDGCYSGSLGTNGIGLKVVTYLSETVDVLSYNNNQYEHIWFEDGLFIKREVGYWRENNSGTIVTWKPDKQYFQNNEPNVIDLKNLFESISALCPKLTIEFNYNNENKIYHSEKGINTLLDNKVKSKEILSNRFSIRREEADQMFDIALTYTSDYSENIIPYVNYGLTESGVHISNIKSLLTKQINKFAIDNNINKKDPLTSAEITEGLILVFNIRSNKVNYDSQTKIRVVSIKNSLINTVINNDFADWLNNNKKDAIAIVEKALSARKAKEAAQKAKDAVRNATTKGKKFIDLPTKLVDAYSKNRQECELYLCEGNSAHSGLVAKRNGKTQASFPLRGKVLSVRKASLDKIYANQEISNIVKAIGLEVDKSSGKLIYDEDKLRYGKIILAADSDVDGYNICSLIINLFWEICPEIIKNGKLYKAIPPLYRITTSKNEYIFLKGEKELEEYKKIHKNEKFIIGRNKGLGECDPEENAICLLRPETRHVEQLIANSEEEVENLLYCFFDTDVEVRKNYLLEHYNDLEDF